MTSYLMQQLGVESTSTSFFYGLRANPAVQIQVQSPIIVASGHELRVPVVWVTRVIHETRLSEIERRHCFALRKIRLNRLSE